MTKFTDGPAKGQTLMLKRTPIFLRVACKDGKFDALDQPSDEARPGELLFCYILAAKPQGHVTVRGTGGVGGIYPLAQYRLYDLQPAQAIMRHNSLWCHWCEAQPTPTIP